MVDVDVCGIAPCADGGWALVGTREDVACQTGPVIGLNPSKFPKDAAAMRPEPL